MMTFRLLALLLVASVVSVLETPVHAQSGTPAANSQESGACTNVEPRDAASFETLPGTPASAAAEGSADQNAAATPTPFAMPDGEPADEARVAEVTALYETLIACLNAGDYLRAYALFSDEYLVNNLSEELLASMTATPVPAEESRRNEFGGVLDARILEDGRIAALVTTRNPISGEILLFSVLRHDDERLLIDEERIIEAETPPTEPGTPTG